MPQTIISFKKDENRAMMIQLYAQMARFAIEQDDKVQIRLLMHDMILLYKEFSNPDYIETKGKEVSKSVSAFNRQISTLVFEFF